MTFCYFILKHIQWLLLHYISETNIVVFTSLHLSDSYSQGLLCLAEDIINKPYDHVIKYDAWLINKSPNDMK